MKKSSILVNLTLTNTLTSKKEIFNSIDPDRVTMYVCGITPYDFPHIGHGRCYVTFDVLYRLLTLLGYQVDYCRNFTDIEDKLISRAEKELNDPNKYKEIAARFIDIFHENMATLNCITPKIEPRVTDHIAQIIKFIQGLIDKNKAYVVNGDVYFSIKSFPTYGKLSKRNLSDLQSGARVEIREEKEDPLDFALWKKSDEEPYWQSPWGLGRPGWAIECSVMANQYLGDTLDIHAGGMDLIFPHHENEIAQSEALHDKTFANYWLHNAFVRINTEKMSKSLGNFITIKELCERFNPMVVRYYFLIHHYRSPLDFSYEDVEVASKSYQRLCKFFEPYKLENFEDLCLEEVPLIKQLVQALCDDLNISKFFGLIFENLKSLETDLLQAGLTKALLQQVLGLKMEPLPVSQVVITPEIQDLITQREEARINKNWSKADELRDKLKALGYEVQDKKL